MKTLLAALALTIGLPGFVKSQNRKKNPEVKLVITIKTPIDSAFNYIVPVELPHIFKKHKMFPAIVGTSNKEHWIKSGLKRTVYFEDGSTAEETLLSVIPCTSFSYELFSFTSKLRFLAKKIEGSWLFTDMGNGQTQIEWTYTMIPKNRISRTILKAFVIKDLRFVLKTALTILKDDLEQNQFSGSK